MNYPISVFLDSNVFIGFKFDFSSIGTLEKLVNLVNEGKIKIFTSHIVIEEVKKHVEKEVSLSVAIYNSSITKFSKNIARNLLAESTIKDSLHKLKEDSIFTEIVAKFDDFLSRAHIEVLDSSDVDCNEIMEKYFKCEVPFENTADKKHEFPDAIMSAKILSMFDDSNPIYIVSSDKGFCESLRSESGITIVQKVKDIMDLISKNDQCVYELIVNFVKNSSTKNEILEKIKDEIEGGNFAVDGQDWDSDGIVEGYEYEEYFIEELSDFDYELLTIDYISEDTVQLTVNVTGNVKVDCRCPDYNNAVYDSEDKQLIILDTIVVDEEHEANFECSINLSSPVPIHEMDLEEYSPEEYFEIENVNFNLSLDQDTLSTREHRPQFDRYEEDDDC